MQWLREFTEVLVPIFVALSPLTILPVFLSMTDGMEALETRQLARRAVVTALSLAIAVVVAGQYIHRFLGITVDDLRVAGGVILLLISIYGLIFTREQRKTAELGSDAGIVPLGTPLIVGPATMTTSVVRADSHGRIVVVTALAINLFLIGFLLDYADQVKRVVRPSMSKAFGKVMSLFLAVIAVAMLRIGIAAFIRSAS
jgi:multiple antibiotic resistance protein